MNRNMTELERWWGVIDRTFPIVMAHLANGMPVPSRPLAGPCYGIQGKHPSRRPLSWLHPARRHTPLLVPKLEVNEGIVIPLSKRTGDITFHTPASAARPFATCVVKFCVPSMEHDLNDLDDKSGSPKPCKTRRASCQCLVITLLRCG
jgi:hypothetical protein